MRKLKKMVKCLFLIAAALLSLEVVTIIIDGRGLLINTSQHEQSRTGGLIYRNNQVDLSETNVLIERMPQKELAVKEDLVVGDDNSLPKHGTNKIDKELLPHDKSSDEKSNIRDIRVNRIDKEQTIQKDVTDPNLVLNENSASNENNIHQKDASQKGLSVLIKESKDIFDLLPEKYLPDYKSFCWYNKDEFKCLASVYIAGMPKCGTTDLFVKMMRHPQLTYQTHADGDPPKEYHYWARSRVARNKWLFADPKRRSHKELFSKFLKGTGAERVKTNLKIQIVDGTPSLLWDLAGWDRRYPKADEPPYSNGDLIHSVTPDAKIIGILRDPIDRLYSEYLYFWLKKSEVRTPETFHTEVVKEVLFFNSCLTSNKLRSCCYPSRAMNTVKIRLELGIYVCFVQDFLEAFGTNLLILTLEEYHLHPVDILTTVFNHIEVSVPEDLQKFIEDSKTGNTNTGLKNEVGDILPKTKQILSDFYGPYNSQLALLLQNSKYLFNS
ncbi:carbohydrate sulfotransferase 15-like [Bolinopsis microptera]|uniref:carbohydrate sulfotransferase 15-like n=1 Tax=Bolinopsis microptera TaxID=2820187 RepID=UPI003079B36F